MCLPTGGGKSLLFLLNAFKIQTSRAQKTILLLVPYVSLQQQFHNICLSKNITACCGYRGYQNHTILIEVMDSIHDKACMMFLSELSRKEILHQIYVDEIHVYSTEMHFRPKLESLVLIRSLNVQTILMSATLPSSITTTIIRDFFPVFPPLIIRSSMNRPNIEFLLREKGFVTQSAGKGNDEYDKHSKQMFEDFWKTLDDLKIKKTYDAEMVFNMDESFVSTDHIPGCVSLVGAAYYGNIESGWRKSRLLASIWDEFGERSIEWKEDGSNGNFLIKNRKQVRKRGKRDTSTEEWRK